VDEVGLGSRPPASQRRQQVLDYVADAIGRLTLDGVARVAVDGVDGAGKTCFSDELGSVLTGRGRSVIRASVDGFHQPKRLRYRQGRDSARGFFEDSYDYARLRAALLDPLSDGGNRRYRTAVFDHQRNAPVETPEAVASSGDVLVFDGIFLHRPELRHYWSYSIFLDVSFAVSIPRSALRGIGNPDPTAAVNRRYIGGQEIYIRTARPKHHAAILIDNNDLDAPFIAAERGRDRAPLRGATL
jgi:uridine kinase